VIPDALLVTLTLGALSSALALLLAHLAFPVAADVLMVVAAACGLGAFVSVAGATIRRARQLPGRPDRT
jgi:hypothetical protein